MKLPLPSLTLPAALALCAALLTTAGCSHKYSGKVTNIPAHPAAIGSGPKGNPNPPPALPVEPPSAPPFATPVATPTAVPNPIGGTPTSDIILDNFTLDRVTLAGNTVHFKYDSAVIRDQEQANLEAVTKALADQNLKLLIEGHCDERGTEEYNRSLGERRALALREALDKAKIDPMRIKTISYGKDQPVDPGHDEAAWSKNRRGMFVLLHPKTPAP